MNRIDAYTSISNLPNRGLSGSNATQDASGVRQAQPLNAAQQASIPSLAQAQRATQIMNSMLTPQYNYMRFDVDLEQNRPVVNVMNSMDGGVIRKVGAEGILDLSRNVTQQLRQWGVLNTGALLSEMA